MKKTKGAILPDPTRVRSSKTERREKKSSEVQLEDAKKTKGAILPDLTRVRSGKTERREKNLEGCNSAPASARIVNSGPPSKLGPSLSPC